MIIEQLRIQKSILPLIPNSIRSTSRPYEVEPYDRRRSRSAAYPDVSYRHRNPTEASRSKKPANFYFHANEVDYSSALHNQTRDYYDPLSIEESIELSATDAGGFCGPILQDCIDIIEATIRDFEDVRIRADFLKANPFQ